MKDKKQDALFKFLKGANLKLASLIEPKTSSLLLESRAETISSFTKKYHYNVFVETGTLFGDTPAKLLNDFKKLYSIELGTELYKKAVERFKDFPHITVLHGDSGKVLPELLKKINEPAIFFLDGHYSGGITAKSNISTPIEEEIASIFRHQIKEHVILIDDARLFVGENSYPTIKKLLSTILKEKEKKSFTISNDLIIIEPAIHTDAVNNTTWKKYRLGWRFHADRKRKQLVSSIKKNLGY